MELVTPGIGLIFWTCLIFIVLLLILKKAAFPVISKMLSERERKIEESLRMAQDTKVEMELLQKENEQYMARARAEREAILRQAHEMEVAIREESMAKAKEDYNRMVSAAAAEIERERLSAVEKAKLEIANISIEMAEKILRRELSDPMAQKQQIERELQNIK